jgi:hypothetical protein
LCTWNSGPEIWVLWVCVCLRVCTNLESVQSRYLKSSFDLNTSSYICLNCCNTMKTIQCNFPLINYNCVHLYSTNPGPRTRQRNNQRRIQPNKLLSIIAILGLKFHIVLWMKQCLYYKTISKIIFCSRSEFAVLSMLSWIVVKGLVN